MGGQCTGTRGQAWVMAWLGLAEKICPELGIVTAALKKSIAARQSNELWGEELQGASFSSRLGKETKTTSTTGLDVHQLTLAKGMDMDSVHFCSVEEII
ncbi:hypothetical protein DUI87_18240 [Hirundo rustica rustica]|uniref:Uncharacterized protein n=1 Tax=Hirundo rustica rustica TaxID=333673 RepID=A0A3M0JW38_HIRRU|nr:hypothetical protein DUI87_18240 [Hirundo rustica rustica]